MNRLIEPNVKLIHSLESFFSSLTLSFSCHALSRYRERSEGVESVARNKKQLDREEKRKELVDEAIERERMRVTGVMAVQPLSVPKQM